jgi:lysyl-tRNA synthetase class II
MMELVQSMVCRVAQKVLGTLQLPYERPKDVQFQIGCAITGLIHVRRSRFEGMTHPDLRQRCLAEIDSLINELRVCVERASTPPSGDAASQASSALTRLRDRLFEEFQTSRQGDREVQITKHLFSEEVELALRRLRPLCWNNIDLSPPWRTVKYKDIVREVAAQDWFEKTPLERSMLAHALGAEIAKEYEDFEVTQAVFEKLIEPTLINPTFVTHAPKELIPLAKLSPEDPTTVEVFECCINGQEIAPAYTEQNDPLEQRERLEHQAGGEQQKLDEDFLVALEHGMPPAGGMGMGIDRLCMMLLGQESIRDVILFPQLKPTARVG